MIIQGINDNLVNMRANEELFTTYSLQIKQMIREIEQETKEIYRTEIKLSKTTDSIYIRVFFKNTYFKYLFSIRNHKPRNSYKGVPYNILEYKELTELKQTILDDIHQFIEIKNIKC